jgi:hypothetical protein
MLVGPGAQRDMPDTECTSPRKMMDYYMDQSDGIEACKKRLYLAVIKGEVRARLKGRVLGPEWLKQIAAMKYDEDPLTLPPDLELSVQDAKKLWPL